MSTERSTEGLSESIAIIGMAGELPGAPDLEAYWRNLCDGVESIKTFSRQELLDAGIPAAALDRPSYVHGAGVISGGEDFDATFFDFNPQEAQILDPNFRLFMEHAWMALENAGYDPFVYPGAIGIFGGMMAPQYLMSNILTHPEVCRTAGDLQLRIFNDKDFLASLTAYKLNLQGPSLSVQTACSTSLVATSLACQSLLSYQCDMALAGGVSVPVPGKIGYVAHEGVFSPDGHCRAFDAGAQGTVAGYGVGLVVLKRLEQAITDGDHVHAVIRGWAVNNDGALKVGYTAPSVDGQAEVVAMAQAMAGIEPETVSYVETHGTATPLGDQIEVAALTEVFRESTDQRGFCALGSVKTNIGHLDAAAGVAGLIKTTLALEHRYLPASLHFEQPSPQIDFDSSPFYVQAQSAPWEGGTAPRRAGVSAFAVGGVNAHLVLEEAPAIEPSDAGRPCQLLVLSARTETALATATTRLADALESAAQPDSASLADIAYTLQVGRRAFEHRFAAVCRTREDAAAVLRNRDPQRLLAGRAQRRDHPVTFLFPGLGNHYVGMARELYRDEPVFRQHLDRCAEVLQPHLGLDLRTVLYPAASEASASDEPVNSLAQMLGRSSSGASAAGELLQTRLAQPVVFSVEYALARLLMAWGVVPESLIGYSIGEYVAACLAGVFSLEDALALVAERARRIDELPAGAMLAIPMAESAVRPLLDENLSITAVNGPQVTVVGGPAVAIDALVRRLEARGEVCRRLETSHAFHSHMMEPILEGFRARVAEIELAPPQIPFLSNVTGTWIRAAEATDPGYWANHLRRPVRYADGIDELWREGDRVLLEVGPGQALSSWALQHPAADRAECAALATLPHAFDRQSDQAFLLTALARLWLLGVEVDWTDFSAGERRHRVPLPTYPFERQRYWLEPRPAAGPEDGIANVAAIGDANESTQGNSELRKAENQSDWFYLPVWQPQSPSL
ncbi:MAG: type I polyketide synthase, partial [Acidobacteriota bacterium]